MDKVIEVKCFEHTYNDNTTVEMCGIDFIARRGEKIAILGPNGGGKTTLIKHIVGILKPNKHGIVNVLGVDPTKDFNKIRSRLGIVLQSVDEQLIGPTVLDDVLFSPLNYNYSHDEALKLANNALEMLNITHLKDKVIHYLSGGEKRKVALAGALVLNPELLILDEPFAALDMQSQIELVEIINNICKTLEITVILTTHDVNLVTKFADMVYLISSRHTSQKGTPKELFSQPGLLQQYNLEQPIIIQLFQELKKKNINLDVPSSLEEAVEILTASITNK